MSDLDDQTYVYQVRNRESGLEEHYLSLVSQEIGFQGGLPSEAIVGLLVDGPEFFDPEHFAPNPRFLEFLHEVIAKHASNCPPLMAEAKRQQEGYIYLIDLRTPHPDGEVPPQDVLGAVQIEGGVVTGYQSNPNYLVFTADGVIKLDSWNKSKWVEEIKRIVTESK